jgi:hypothetical protein
LEYILEVPLKNEKNNFSLIASAIALGKLDKFILDIEIDEFQPFIKFISSNPVSNKLKIIHYHNIIMSIYNIFRNRITLLREKHFYLFLPFKWSVLQIAQNSYFSNYFTINELQYQYFLSQIVPSTFSLKSGEILFPFNFVQLKKNKL